MSKNMAIIDTCYFLVGMVIGILVDMGITYMEVHYTGDDYLFQIAVLQLFLNASLIQLFKLPGFFTMGLFSGQSLRIRRVIEGMK